MPCEPRSAADAEPTPRQGYTRGVSSKQPLWPGIQNGRPKPIFAYPIEESEYLDLEEQSDTKHEYVDGYVYAMAGASDAHVTIMGNLVVAIRPLLANKKCKDYFADMRTAIPGLRNKRKNARPSYYYPDFMITCSPADLSASTKTIKTEPCLVAEILSPGTQLTDRTEKLDNYQKLASLAQYWLVDQEQHRVIVYSRGGAEWQMTEHTDPESMIPLPIDELVVRLGDLYAKAFDL
jgi:Uma2 family endonuclease